MSPLKKNLLIVTVLMAAVMELIDTTIVNVALSHMSGNLGATLEDTSWVVTSYAIANVIIIPITSFLTARLGRRNYYIGSIIIFTICSFMCGQSSDIWTLVFFRFLQGLGGGALLSVSQAVIFELFPREKQGAASAIFGIGVFIGPTIGPTLGGFITENYSWPWIFYVNIPVGAIAAFCAYTFVRETPKEGQGKPVDWWGIALLAVAVGSLQTILEKGESEDWFAKTYIIVLTVTAVLGTLCFIWREMSIDHPIVNFGILRHRSFAVGMFTSFVLGFGLYGSVFVFPVFCQNLLGFTAQQTGELLFPGGLCTIIMMPFIGKMLNGGIPAQFMATAGMFLFFVFTTMLSHSTLSTGQEDVLIPLLIRGVGMALLFVPLTTLAIADLKGPELGQGTGLNNMMRQLGGSFGIAVLTTIIHIRSGLHRSNLLSNIDQYNPAFNQRLNMLTQAFMAKGKSLLDATHMAYSAIEGAVVRQTLLLTYDDAYWISGLVMLFSIPLLYLQPFKKAAKLPVDAH